MDTKLKKSKYNPFVKATAFIMTIVCAYLFAFNGVNCLRKGIFFQSQDDSFRNTPAFISAMTDTLINISSYTDILSFYEEDLTFEEFLESDQAKSTIKEYEEQKEKALLIFNTIQKLKPLEPDPVNDTLNGDFGHAEDNRYYDYTNEEYINSDEFSAYYQNNYSSEDVTIVEFRQEDNFNELLKIKSSYDSYDEWNKKYQELRSAIFAIVDDATNESTITDELDLQCEEMLENSYYLSVEQTNEFLDEFVNIDFILKDNETGKCVSTLKKSEQKAFIDTIEDNSLYHVAYNNQKVAGDIISVKSESNVIRFLKDADFLPDETINDIYLKNQFGNYSLYLKVKDNIIQGDIFYNLHQSYLAVKDTELQTYSTLTVIFALLSLAGVVLCCSMCGKRKDDSVKLLLTDKVPFIIALTFAIAGIVLFAFLVLAGIITDFSPDYINLTNKSPFIWLFTNNVVHVFVCLCTALLSFTITSFAMYISRNNKANELSDRFLIGFIVKRLSKIKAKIKRKEKTHSLKQISKITLISLIGYVVINCFFFLLSCAELYIISVPCLVIFNALCIVYAGLYLSDVIRLTRISEKICTGEHIEEIRPDTFVKPLQGFATNLSAVHDSIEAAVAEAIKGEHLKTELITNVSHDLKTPLTSIINYVSLLKMCATNDEDAKKYIEILDDKSKKLKRLIDDLTEASKATSGNVKMNTSPVMLNELALQAVGENNDVLVNAGLELILNQRDSDIFVLADSQHTFRIIDNLFSNARKYSLTGTRVYVDVYKEGKYGVFSVKNISKDELNLTPDELTERFVRGDNSRSTDGSGLGLSIARSFTELQGGIFEIIIDGDMFKANVKLPLTDSRPKYDTQ